MKGFENEKRKQRRKAMTGQQIYDVIISSPIHVVFDNIDSFNHKDEKWTLFQEAASKGHKESQWICNVLKDIDINDINLVARTLEATNSPIGWYWAAIAYYCVEDYTITFTTKEKCKSMLEKSANTGFIPAIIHSTWYLERQQQVNVLKDINHPRAWMMLGQYLESTDYLLRAVNQGCTYSAKLLVCNHTNIIDCLFISEWIEKISSFKNELFEKCVDYIVANQHFDLDDFVYMHMGKGLYWYDYPTAPITLFYNYYCENIDIQQESLYLFLLIWKTFFGSKDVGTLIAKYVWKDRYNFPILNFFYFSQR